MCTSDIYLGQGHACVQVILCILNSKLSVIKDENGP